MDFPSIKKMPDDARVWVHGFDKKMDSATRARVTADLKTFIDSWTSHNERVHGAFEIVEDQFVVLSGWCESGLGGCSIDSSFGLIRSFRDKYGLDGLNRDLVFYRSTGGAVEAATRGQFGDAVSSGRLGGHTIVFDLTVTTVGDLRAGRFESTFDNCWHSRVFAA
jgi:hypothetical protein